MNRHGDFGLVSSRYEKGRKEYPEEVISECFKNYSEGNVLDLGCGTGISTRQLKLFTRGKLIGTDINKEMLEKASGDIEYLQADTKSLPFEDSSFSLITAFSAFHWFHEREDLEEILRVLKPKGSFVVVNRYNSYSKGIKEYVFGLLNKEAPNAKIGYNPKQHLIDAGFTKVEQKEFVYKESITLEDALAYYHSTSWSNEVPQEMDDKVREHLSSKINPETGELNVEIKIILVSGQKA